MFHKNKMGSIIRPSGTICCSLLYYNSWIGYHELKCLYSVISEIDKRLPGNTRKWTNAPFVDGQSAISPSLGGETLELWALSFETAFENVTASGIGGCIVVYMYNLCCCIHVSIQPDVYVYMSIKNTVFTRSDAIESWVAHIWLLYKDSVHSISPKIHIYIHIYAYTCTNTAFSRSDAIESWVEFFFYVYMYIGIADI